MKKEPDDLKGKVVPMTPLRRDERPPEALDRSAKTGLSWDEQNKQLELLLPAAKTVVTERPFGEAADFLRENAYKHPLSDDQMSVALKVPYFTFMDPYLKRATVVELNVAFVPDCKFVSDEVFLQYLDFFRNREATPEKVAWAIRLHLVEALAPVKGSVTINRKTGRVGGKFVARWDITKDCEG